MMLVGALATLFGAFLLSFAPVAVASDLRWATAGSDTTGVIEERWTAGRGPEAKHGLSYSFTSDDGRHIIGESIPSDDLWSNATPGGSIPVRYIRGEPETNAYARSVQWTSGSFVLAAFIILAIGLVVIWLGTGSTDVWLLSRILGHFHLGFGYPIAVLVALLALAVLALGTLMIASTFPLEFGPRVDATIVSKRMVEDPDSASGRRYFVRYSYASAGAPSIEGEAEVGVSQWSEVDVGDRFAIRYDRERPSDSLPAAAHGGWWGAVTVFGYGVAYLGASVGVFALARASRNMRASTRDQEPHGASP